LPKDIVKDCLLGIIKSRSNLLSKDNELDGNFEGWIRRTFGPGIAEHFMLPYNAKVWAYPLEKMSANWISDRVGHITLEEATAHLVHNTTKKEWGPNASFLYPKEGGVHGMFKRLAELVQDHLHLCAEVKEIDAKAKRVYLTDGREDHYDLLINTGPLDQLLARIRHGKDSWPQLGKRLKHNSLLVVGIGIERICSSKKCWVYFSEDSCPFNRMTYLSNYSEGVTPEDQECFSLLCETTYSEHKPIDKTRIVELTMQGLIDTGILKESDRKKVLSQYVIDVPYAYPIPTLDRDEVLRETQSGLESYGIYSKGRFGAWLYEKGNMDHAVEQGKEIADQLIESIRSQNFGRSHLERQSG